MASRHSSASSWSTSSSSVLSDWTMSGPSVTRSLSNGCGRTYQCRSGRLVLERGRPGDPVDGEGVHLGRAVVVGGEVPAGDAHRVHHPLGDPAVGVDVPDPDRAALLEGGP